MPFYSRCCPKACRDVRPISPPKVNRLAELSDLEGKIAETEETVKALTIECDKTDYILSASSGALCGIMDIFLVGKPGESPIGDLTDKWFAERTKSFAKLCKWDSSGDDSLKSAIKHLEKKFKIPCDQSVGGSIFRELINLTPVTLQSGVLVKIAICEDHANEL